MSRDQFGDRSLPWDDGEFIKLNGVLCAYSSYKQRDGTVIIYRVHMPGLVSQAFDQFVSAHPHAFIPTNEHRRVTESRSRAVA